MKGNHLKIIIVSCFVCLFFSGNEAIARVNGCGGIVWSEKMVGLQGDAGDSVSSEAIFPEPDVKIAFSDFVNKISVSLVSQNKKAFYRWMRDFKWQQIKPGDRDPLKSYLFWLRGTLRLSEGDVDVALIDLNKSFVAARNLTPPLDSMVPKILNNLALAFEIDRDYPKAIGYYQKCVSFFENSENKTLKKQWLFFSLNNLASLFNKTGNYDQADSYFKDAAVLLNIDTIGRENSFFIVNLLSYYHNSGQSGAFHELQKRSEAYFAGSEVGLEDKAIYLNLTGGMYFMEGNYRKAIDYKNRALSFARHIGNVRLSNLIESHLVHCYFSLGYYSQAEKFAKNILQKERGNGTLNIRISVLLAKIYAREGKADLALSLLDEVQNSLKSNKSNSVLKVSVYYNAGLTYALLNEHKEAERCFAARLALLKRYFPGNFTYIINSYYGIGASNFYLGNFSKAESFFLKALAVIEGENTDRLSVTDHKLSLLVHLALARISKTKWLERPDPEHIICGMEHVHKSVELMDRFRVEMEFDQDRITLAGRVEEILDLGVWLSAQNYLLAPNDDAYDLFFSYSQRKKNNSLMMAIKEKNAYVRANLPPSLFNSENEAKRKVATLQYHLVKEKEKENPDEKKISYWQKSLVASYRDLDSLKEIIRVNHPGYYQLKYQSPFIGLKQAQANLDSSQVFMDLFLNEDFLLINLITPDTVMVVEKATGASVLSAAEKFRNEAVRPFNGFSTRDDIRAFFENGYELYHEIFEPVGKLIRGKRLILAPDPVLASLPFEALVTRKPDEKTLFNNAPWLIFQHPVSYLYNAALLLSVNDKNQVYSELAAFVPDYHGTEAMHDSVLSGIRQGLNSKLRPIPGALEEVNKISRLFGGRKFVDSEASVSNFEKQLQGNKVLHLAMHSLVSDVDPMDSKLVFSPAGADSSGVLEAHAIYGFRTNSPLIALSSCNSGTGKESAGEGIMSLSRAFAFAGANSTLMTLWPVNDKVASRLISSFYQNLKNGLAKDEALGKAKSDLLKSASPLHAHPYYWANYVVSGNQSPLVPEPGFLPNPLSRAFAFSGMAFLLVMIGIFVRSSRKRKNKLND